MKSTKILLIGFLLFMISNVNAQSLSQYRWENRLVLLLTESNDNAEYQEQITIFHNENKGLKERKIIVYRVVPSDELFKEYKKTESAFEFVLIGLDGGEKLRRNSHLSIEKLYAIIDGMPMRRSELGN